MAVLPEHRRRGIGTALARHRLAAAAAAGIDRAVAALSSDGAHVYRSLGFESVPVRADVSWYLPTT